MIVICPKCASKYRVRDEVIPDDGAEMLCPACDTRFVAKAPVPSYKAIKKQADEYERRALDAEQAKAKMQAELALSKTEHNRALLAKDEELSQWRTDAATAKAGTAALTKDITRLADELAAAQNTIAALKADLLAARENTAKLQQQQQMNDAQMGQVEHLRSESNRLREQLALLSNALTKAEGNLAKPAVQSLISAFGPMLWGLENAIRALDPLLSKDPSMATHLRQLQLLAGVLTRLQKEALAA